MEFQLNPSISQFNLDTDLVFVSTLSIQETAIFFHSFSAASLLSCQPIVQSLVVRQAQERLGAKTSLSRGSCRTSLLPKGIQFWKQNSKVSPSV